MNWHDFALIGAGVVGSVTAIIHGVLTQRFIAKPVDDLAGKQLSGQIRRLAPGLLHYSTYSWLLCGLALIAAAVWFDQPARLVTGLFVASHYAYGVIGNFWATRGRHPGWMLLALSIGLIAFGLAG
jgi:hypothetical protein